MMDRHILTAMRNTPSRTLTAITRIMLLMFAFGLLSQAVQACAPAKPHIVAAADNTPCQAGAKNADTHFRCAPSYQAQAEDCAMQVPVAVSSERFSPLPTPVAIAVSLMLVPPVKPLLIIGLDAPPPIHPLPPVPLSILHCSFQI